jgi:hypothetical protein
MFVYPLCKFYTPCYLFFFAPLAFLYPIFFFMSFCFDELLLNSWLLCNFSLFLYVQVVYIDFLKTGQQQLPPTLPRISVWKGDMIKEMAKFDCVQGHTYGKCHVSFFPCFFLIFSCIFVSIMVLISVQFIE